MADDFKPYVPAADSPADFTVKSVITGAVLGLLFGTANTYLGLTAGLTVSTSIPIAVMSVAVFRALRILGPRSTVLEGVTSQTVGSGSSSVASGVIFTIPALFLWGANPTLLQIAALALLGAFLGITFMIPLRRYLVVNEHQSLPYPEGTAAAKVLIASDTSTAQAKPLLVGLLLGLLVKCGSSFLMLWKETVVTRVPGLFKSQVGIKSAPALLGVGYILGPRTGSIMVSGSLISWAMLIPLIAHFGRDLAGPVFPETMKRIAEMSATEIWERYIRYIGAGAVAMAGIATVMRSIPTMVKSFRLGASQFKRGLAGEREKVERTARDLPIAWILAVAAIIILIIAAIPGLVGKFDTLGQRTIVALAITIFAFFFVTVSSRIVGLIGVSSNPTSGMTIVTLLGTSMVFYLLGWTDLVGKITALMVGTVVCVAASMAGDISQDLKTGYLVGATPVKQQLGSYIGAVTSVWGVAYAVSFLHEAYGFGTLDLPAPQAMLMKTVVDGVLSAQIPWSLVFIGSAFTLVIELLGIRSLPFAVGMYLPVTTMTPIFFGGLLRRVVEHRFEKDPLLERRREGGILFSSGLIAGEGLLGVGIAAYTYFVHVPKGLGDTWLGPLSAPFSLALFAGLASLIYLFCKRHE